MAIETKSALSVTNEAQRGETILILGPERKELLRLQRKLQGGGYLTLSAAKLQEAEQILSTRRVQLVIVNGQASAAAVQPTQPRSAGRNPKKASRELPVPGLSPSDEHATARAVKALAAAARVPMLMICPLWPGSAIDQAMELDADSILFAPYQPADLIRSVRDALLNGPLEQEAPLPEVNVIQNDRTHRVTAGRARLARLGFSALEELRQCRAQLSWSRAEVQDLRRQLRKLRRQSQRAMQPPLMLQGIAHDFRNLLQTVNAAATLLCSAPAQPQPYRDAIDAALAQAGTLLLALQNWSDSEMEPEPVSFETVDLNQMAQEVLEATLLSYRAPKTRVRLRMEGLPAVKASGPLLMRILSNLVWNAVEAMPGGGMLTLLGYQQRNRVVLEVSDTGVGMSAAEQEKVFRTQFSTKRGHAGMGLLLVQRMVQRAGGEITFASKPSRGSTFALSFPVAEGLPESNAVPGLIGCKM